MTTLKCQIVCSCSEVGMCFIFSSFKKALLIIEKALSSATIFGFLQWILIRCFNMMHFPTLIRAWQADVPSPGRRLIRGLSRTMPSMLQWLFRLHDNQLIRLSVLFRNFISHIQMVLQVQDILAKFRTPLNAASSTTSCIPRVPASFPFCLPRL